MKLGMSEKLVAETKAQNSFFVTVATLDKFYQK